MNKQELFEKIDGLYQDFVAQHNGTTKKSQANARKAIGEVKKLITEYRKASTEDSKTKEGPKGEGTQIPSPKVSHTN
jgi:hypothetical protein